MNLHFLGIGGTFMSGAAALAKALGFHVTGSDQALYPPMNIQLEKQKIPVFLSYAPEFIPSNVDLIIVGNVIKRGNPSIEYILNNKIPFTSGPAWLYENILRERKVLAVSGTHGKTTTASLLAWLLESAGLNPGFLIGGVLENFGISARLGDSPYFVIEADEYDTAFFDKRSKFIHYHPDCLLINNLEFDHADIFPNLEAIAQQFQHLIRTIPSDGVIVYPADDLEVSAVVSRECYSQQRIFGNSQGLNAKVKTGNAFKVYDNNDYVGEVNWDLLGMHNITNALAALTVLKTLDLPLAEILPAFTQFKNVKRRLEIKGVVKGITIYDDFAHHPTAIDTTLKGLRAKVGNAARIITVLEFGSYTMRNGFHRERLRDSLQAADYVVFKKPACDFGMDNLFKDAAIAISGFDNEESIVDQLKRELKAGDHVVIMSNTGFGNIHQKLLTSLS